jgi:hypothetical protein
MLCSSHLWREQPSNAVNRKFLNLKDIVRQIGIAIFGVPPIDRALGLK